MVLICVSPSDSLRVNLNEEWVSVFFSIFPKFRGFPIVQIEKTRQIPKFRENVEINLKNSPR